MTNNMCGKQENFFQKISNTMLVNLGRIWITDTWIAEVSTMQVMAWIPDHLVLLFKYVILQYMASEYWTQEVW